ncbi:hypothetical protein H3M12_10585 [Levilactobacillus suantsaii]|uniref:hypothetical protein n=1 Tax=Levilactobacillus suantsaii TaxID=2292255 RepID=UPI0015F3C759|nr:hypothetical protein [Levilactobacillus suantsaii]QMU07872.1 hypothetical protein H3M12_10585 [Levilactobacillus suantsaii]
MLRPRRRVGHLKPKRRNRGWLLPDALLALSIVALTLVMSYQALQVTQHVERVREARLASARLAHDRALERELAGS